MRACARILLAARRRPGSPTKASLDGRVVAAHCTNISHHVNPIPHVFQTRTMIHRAAKQATNRRPQRTLSFRLLLLLRLKRVCTSFRHHHSAECSWLLGVAIAQLDQFDLGWNMFETYTEWESRTGWLAGSAHIHAIRQKTRRVCTL